MRLAATYLALERRRNLALDPVANFHLRNGSHLWRINWRADVSHKGLTQSHGLMVNYKYRLPEVHVNHVMYMSENKVCLSPKVKALLGDASHDAMLHVVQPD